MKKSNSDSLGGDDVMMEVFNALGARLEAARRGETFSAPEPPRRAASPRKMGPWLKRAAAVEAQRALESGSDDDNDYDFDEAAYEWVRRRDARRQTEPGAKRDVEAEIAFREAVREARQEKQRESVARTPSPGRQGSASTIQNRAAQSAQRMREVLHAMDADDLEGEEEDDDDGGVSSSYWDVEIRQSHKAPVVESARDWEIADEESHPSHRQDVPLVYPSENLQGYEGDGFEEGLREEKIKWEDTLRDRKSPNRKGRSNVSSTIRGRERQSRRKAGLYFVGEQPLGEKEQYFRGGGEQVPSPKKYFRGGGEEEVPSQKIYFRGGGEEEVPSQKTYFRGGGEEEVPSQTIYFRRGGKEVFSSPTSKKYFESSSSPKKSFRGRHSSSYSSPEHSDHPLKKAPPTAQPPDTHPPLLQPWPTPPPPPPPSQYPAEHVPRLLAAALTKTPTQPAPKPRKRKIKRKKIPKHPNQQLILLREQQLPHVRRVGGGYALPPRNELDQDIQRIPRKPLTRPRTSSQNLVVPASRINALERKIHNIQVALQSIGLRA